MDKKEIIKLLKEDIRKLIIKPYQIIAILKKNSKDEKYEEVIYKNKKIDISVIEKYNCLIKT